MTHFSHHNMMYMVKSFRLNPWLTTRSPEGHVITMETTRVYTQDIPCIPDTLPTRDPHTTTNL